jgi:hypothetical protein
LQQKRLLDDVAFLRLYSPHVCLHSSVSRRLPLAIFALDLLCYHFCVFPLKDRHQKMDRLLETTNKRLLIAVPCEEQAQALYGHHQTFTLEKLHFWGNWCIEQLKGRGCYQCEQVMGGMLIIERV